MEKDFQHFILTRFNLLLWRKDKEGNKVRTTSWLEHRFSLFEHFCMPSIRNQVCKDFQWIVLFDSTTPERFKEKITQYQEECPQLIPIFVIPERECNFADVFREEIINRLEKKRVLTTYLDNDDALNVRFVEDIQHRALLLSNNTFINYNDGYQYFVKDNYLMMIHYPTNHFISLLEDTNPIILKSVFGYGSHAYIEKIKGVKIEQVKNLPMWCEVVHEKNMINDAYFINAKIVNDSKRFKEAFGVDVETNKGLLVYAFDYLPRYVRTFLRRTKYYLLGRNW